MWLDKICLFTFQKNEIKTKFTCNKKMSEAKTKIKRRPNNENVFVCIYNILLGDGY